MHKGFLLEVIRYPVITEKSNFMSNLNKVIFEVAVFANKLDIKEAVEEIFGVKVESVNVLNRRGKPKQFKGRQVKRSGKKYAIVTLQKGEHIELGIGA